MPRTIYERGRDAVGFWRTLCRAIFASLMDEIPVTSQAQFDFDAPMDSELQRQFDEWRETPGGRRILQDLFELANQYARAWRRTGIPVSMKLLFEVERQRIKTVTARAQSRGIELEKDYGYSLNNSRTAYVARFIMERRKDLAGMFETRTERAA